MSIFLNEETDSSRSWVTFLGDLIEQIEGENSNLSKILFFY